MKGWNSDHDDHTKSEQGEAPMYLCEHCHEGSDCAFVHMKTERRMCHNCGNPAVCVDCKTATNLPEAGERLEVKEPERVCTHPFHAFKNYYEFKQCPTCEEDWKTLTAGENASSLVNKEYYPRGQEPVERVPPPQDLHSIIGGSSRLKRAYEIAANVVATELGDTYPAFLLPSHRIVEDLNADSLDTVEIVMALEELLDMEISDEDAMGFFQTLGGMAQWICDSGPDPLPAAPALQARLREPQFLKDDPVGVPESTEIDEARRRLNEEWATNRILDAFGQAARGHAFGKDCARSAARDILERAYASISL